ncbi:hypothetical protein CRUP_011500 [Coryphaenoides rupestris]|nr:hypothetical protein CRUP_011500 [Coryphaenoides rupestris]
MGRRTCHTAGLGRHGDGGGCGDGGGGDDDMCFSTGEVESPLHPIPGSPTSPQSALGGSNSTLSGSASSGREQLRGQYPDTGPIRNDALEPLPSHLWSPPEEYLASPYLHIHYSGPDLDSVDQVRPFHYRSPASHPPPQQHPGHPHPHSHGPHLHGGGGGGGGGHHTHPHPGLDGHTHGLAHGHGPPQPQLPMPMPMASHAHHHPHHPPLHGGGGGGGGGGRIGVGGGGLMHGGHHVPYRRPQPPPAVPPKPYLREGCIPEEDLQPVPVPLPRRIFHPQHGHREEQAKHPWEQCISEEHEEAQ